MWVRSEMDMNNSTRIALIELKEWCQRYHAVIEKSCNHAGLLQITFGQDLEDTDRVYFGQFDAARTSVIREERETI